jgi:hypothetical protein
MIHFLVGERVIIRYGKHQGQMAKVIKCLPAGDYKVRAVDGSVLFYTGKGLEKNQGTEPTVGLK